MTAPLGLLLFLLLSACALGLLCWGVASLGLSQVEVAHSLSQDEVEIGAQVTVRLQVRNNKAFPVPWLLLSDQVDRAAALSPLGPSCALLGLRPFGRRELTYQLTAARRGLYRVGPVLLESSGPLGLLHRSRLSPRACFLTVLPKVVPLQASFAARPVHEVPRRRSLLEDPSRYVGVREYRAGDDRRRIHFRATARAGRLQSRVYEPSVMEGLLIALEMDRRAYAAGPKEDAEARVELAVTTAASLAEHVLGAGQMVGLISNGGDAAERYPREWPHATLRRVEVTPGKGAWQRGRVRTALARLEETESASLGLLLLRELPRLPRQLVLAVVSPRLDRELGAALGALARSGFELAVIWVRGDEGEEDRAHAALPPRVAVHQVSSLDSLAALGAARL